MGTLQSTVNGRKSVSPEKKTGHKRGDPKCDLGRPEIELNEQVSESEGEENNDINVDDHKSINENSDYVPRAKINIQNFVFFCSQNLLVRRYKSTTFDVFSCLFSYRLILTCNF